MVRMNYNVRDCIDGVSAPTLAIEKSCYHVRATRLQAEPGYRHTRLRY